MAKFLPGPVIAAASGSIGGTVFSHNKGGMYMRNRSIPTISTTEDALNAKARLSNRAQAWGGLTAAQRLAWEEWAAQNPIIDTLGQSRILSGIAAYVQLNTIIEMSGESVIASPPITAPPSPLTSLSATTDIGAGTFQLTFTPTPLAADDMLVSWVAVLNSPGINYVQNYLRLVDFSAKAQATGLDIQTEIEARLGALVVGQIVHFHCQVLDSATGLRSGIRKTSGTVVST